MSPLRSIGPACIAVCISSPVRSKKPVLMNATLARASLMQAFRLALVRRSSSMMPSLTVLAGKPKSASTRLKSSLAKATSAGPCIFGLTIYTEPVRELPYRCSLVRLRSCSAIATVTTASRMPSNISLPWPSRIAGLVIRCPTLRKNKSERPCSVTTPSLACVAPIPAWYFLSAFRVRLKVLPFLVTLSTSVPFKMPNQLL